MYQCVYQGSRKGAFFVGWQIPDDASVAKVGIAPGFYPGKTRVRFSPEALYEVVANVGFASGSYPDKTRVRFPSASLDIKERW